QLRARTSMTTKGQLGARTSMTTEGQLGAWIPKTTEAQSSELAAWTPMTTEGMSMLEISSELGARTSMTTEDLVGSRVSVSLRVEGRPGGIQGIVIPLRVVKRRPTASREHWTEDDRKKISLNCKAKSVLCCAFSKKEFNRVSAYKSAMEMWGKLRITYEGTDKVKESRIDILVTQYVRFQM
ncbi:hypothetical protein Taro_025002, partial [Colocasia esculenta]|nr:hypothetical protein [Colocasia esculenta]